MCYKNSLVVDICPETIVSTFNLVKDKIKMAVVFIFINGIVLLNVCQCVGLLLEGGTVEHIQLQQLRSAIDRSKYK